MLGAVVPPRETPCHACTAAGGRILKGVDVKPSRDRAGSLFQNLTPGNDCGVTQRRGSEGVEVGQRSPESLLPSILSLG